MAGMYKKVNAKENVIGWYATKKKISDRDSDINKIFSSYNNEPIFLLFWTEPQLSGFFIEAFSETGKIFETLGYFKTLQVGIGMLESEEIGVFQILRESSLNYHKNYLQAHKKWKQVLKSFAKYIKKIFLRVSSTSILKNWFLKTVRLRKLVKKISSISFEKKIIEDNLFFLYSCTILRVFISFEQIVISSFENCN